MAYLKSFLLHSALLIASHLRSGDSVQFLQTPRGSKALLEDFIPYFCYNFFLEKQADDFSTNYEDVEEQTQFCTDNFFGSKNPKLPPPSKIEEWCQTNDDVSFTVAPSQYWQLVLLLPESDGPNASIEYVLLNASETTGRMDTKSRYKATLWTTILNEDGTSSLWLQGPEVPPWNVTSNVTVNIEEPEFSLVKSSSSRLVDVTFKWSYSLAPRNICTMTITNFCYLEDALNGNYTTRILKTSAKNVTISNLSIDTHCDFAIEMNGLKFVRNYTTSCYDIEGCLPLPEPPQEVYAEAAETSDGLGWDVEVSWVPPKHQPEGYNVTLRADGVYHQWVSGNATSTAFYSVKGNKTYNVSVYSIANGHRHSKSKAYRFPDKSGQSWLVWAMASAWCACATVAAMTALAAVWWRRRRAHLTSNIYLEPDHLKLPKECSEFGPESGTEDAWEVRSERLLLHEVIGEGAFGVVRRGTLATGGKEVAVKMLKDFPTLEEIRSFRAESELMKSVGAHPHIVSLVGCCSGRRPLLVAEYCSQGDLLSYLRCCWDVMVSKRNAKYYNNNLETSEYRNDLFKAPQKEGSKLVVNKMYDLEGICDAELTPLDLLSFCRQIAMGMEFLASNRVVHRDLAARNILVTGDRTLKIADFGLSRDVYQENQYKQKGNGKMPVKWMALESLTHRIYTTQSDVWSFGVVIWEVVTVGGAPYPDVPAARLPRLLKSGYRMPRPNNCSKALYDLMSSCWLARPRDRPTFAQLHAGIDELLNRACAHHYLSLELDDADIDAAPRTPRHQRYLSYILSKSNRVWSRDHETYERPLKPPQSNHYTSPPNARPQPV